MEMDAQSYAKASELFQREALRLDELGHHEQIPKLYAYFEQEQRQYIIQEFIDGNNLARELQLYGPYNEAKALQLLRDLVPVLEFVHNHHVIHRDVKPENVIRSGVNGKLYLVDFGAAKFAPSTSMSNLRTIISSAGFTAPEQMVGKAEFVSDLYSLGVTCVHLMTGRPPLELYDMSQDGWVWQDYMAEPVSPGLAQILNRLLERATRKRYQSATEVRQDLEALNQGSRLGTPSRLQPSSAPTASKLVLNFPQRQKKYHRQPSHGTHLGMCVYPGTLQQLDYGGGECGSLGRGNPDCGGGKRWGFTGMAVERSGAFDRHHPLVPHLHSTDHGVAIHPGWAVRGRWV